MREATASPLRVVRYSAANAWAELWVLYSPLTWATAWLGRVLMQVIFFALIGRPLDSPETVRFLFIGNAMLFACLAPLISVATSTWERRQGALPLLVAAPARPARAAAAFASIVVVAVSTYLLALGGLVLAATGLRNIVSNIASTVMMLIAA